MNKIWKIFAFSVALVMVVSCTAVLYNSSPNVEKEMGESDESQMTVQFDAP